jgi:hypothetical protein
MTMALRSQVKTWVGGRQTAPFLDYKLTTAKKQPKWEKLLD